MLIIHGVIYFLSMESQGCLVIFVAIKSRTFHLYHAVIEHRAGTREDIAGDIDDYVDPKIIIFD